MTALALIFVAAAIAMGLAHWLRFPPVPLLLAAGIGVAVIGLPAGYEAMTNDATMLGLAFLLFVAGTELNPLRFDSNVRTAAFIAILQLAIVTALGVVTAPVFGLSTTSGLVVGLALGASSTLVAVRLLHRRRQLFEPFGRLVLGVLLVQDLCIILALAFVSTTGEGAADAGPVVAGLLALVAVTLACLRWFTPWLVRILGLDPETLILVLLTVLFGFAGFAWMMGLPLAVGAFFAGVSLSAFPVNGLIRAPLASLSDFFLALFFVALGASLELPDGDGLLMAGFLTVGLWLVTPPLVAIIAERAGLTARSGIGAGLLLAQTSELSLVVTLIAREHGLIDPQIHDIIALVTIVTMAVTPVLSHDRVVWWLVHRQPWRKRGPIAAVANHVIVVGCGETGLALAEDIRQLGREVVAIDDDPQVVADVERRGIRCVRGDGADPAVLVAAGLEKAAAIIATMRDPADAQRLVAAAGGRHVLVRVFSEAEAERIRALGGDPVTWADKARVAMVAWLDDNAPPKSPEPGHEIGV